MFVRDRSVKANPRGAIMVEYAIVLPVFILLMIGLIVLGLGVFRYQQVAHLAREGARWASVRGANYKSDTTSAPADQATITTYVKSIANGIDKTKLTCTVVWDSPGSATPPIPGASPVYLFNPAANQYRINNVKVTITYAWSPEALTGILGKTKNLTSAAIMPISY